MNRSDSETDQPGVPEQFVLSVRDALTHLFDIARLQEHPLADTLLPRGIDDPRMRAQYLREALLQAITDLRPPAGISPRDPDYRPYAILKYRYVEKMTHEAIMAKLAISRRQYFREQQRACEAVAAMLWQQRTGEAVGEGYFDQILGEELEQLGLRPETFELLAVAGQAIDAVTGLADSHGVVIRAEVEGSPQVYADKAIARQALVSMLSAVIQVIPSGFVDISLQEEDRWAKACVKVPDAIAGESLDDATELAGQLANRLGGGVEVALAKGVHSIVLSLPAAQTAHVVIVDDNPKTLQLFRRFLERYRYQVTPIQESTEALDHIRRLQPVAVLLDVMMRDLDGWQLLQSLKTDPETRHIPVVVCSVLNEDGLARAIGADAYLRKPVSQSVLATTLAQVRQGSGDVKA